MSFLQRYGAQGQVVTGLIFVERDPVDLHGRLQTVEMPLRALTEKELCPGSSALAAINDSLR
jgi:2-oxoglutarate ferredoxin oxidoreductase subunit beta